MGIRGSLPEMLGYEAGHSLEVKNACDFPLSAPFVLLR